MRIFSIREDALALKFPRMVAVEEDLQEKAVNQEVEEILNHEAAKEAVVEISSPVALKEEAVEISNPEAVKEAPVAVDLLQSLMEVAEEELPSPLKVVEIEELQEKMEAERRTLKVL